MSFSVLPETAPSSEPSVFARAAAYALYVEDFAERVRGGLAGGAPVGFYEFVAVDLAQGELPANDDVVVRALADACGASESMCRTLILAYDALVASAGEDVPDQWPRFLDVLPALQRDTASGVERA